MSETSDSSAPTGMPPVPGADPDRSLASAVGSDEVGRSSLDELAAAVGASRALLEAVARTGMLLPHHVDDAGVQRFSEADADAVRAGMTLLDAGLPLVEMLDVGATADAAVTAIADRAVDAFLRFVRDPVLGSCDDDAEVARRLVDAYQRMLPATERLVAHHFRRRLVSTALLRLAAAESPRNDDVEDRP